MADLFAGTVPGLSDPAQHAQAINLGADTDLSANPSRAILVNGAGNLKVDTLGGEVGVLISVPAGLLLSLRVKKIYSTTNGTTATNVTAFW